MKSNYLDLTFAALGKIALRFLAGAAIGLGFILSAYLHYSYFTSGINPIQIVGSAGFIMLCGTLSAIWGNKIVNTL